MKKILLGMILCIVVLPALVSATEWYVRPSGGSYGTESGTSYDNAWDGFTNINWNSIIPGDNLYVCGLHVTGISALDINSSGTPGNLVTVRGDCSKVNSGYENGIIWAGFRIATNQWTGQAGNYWYKNPWYSHSPNAAEGSAGSEALLTPCTDVACVDNTDGSFYWDHNLSTIYYNPSGTELKDVWTFAAPKGAVHLNAQDYVAVRNLKLRGSGSNRGVILIGNTNIYTGDFSDYWEITGNDIAFSPYTGIYSDGDSDYGLIENNTIHDVPTGTYTITRGIGISDNWVFRNNEVYSGGDRPGLYGMTAADRHALGGQCGNNSLYEYNYIHDWIGDGINVYVGSGCIANNVTIRYNRIINLNDASNQFYHRAIAFSSTNTIDTADRTTGWKIHNNIIWNCGGTLASGHNTNGLGIRLKTGVPPNPDDKIKIYNNIFGDCNIGIAWIPDVAENEIGFELKNNIFYQTKAGGWHVYIHDDSLVTDYSNIIMDNNLYYPGAKFSWINAGDTDFAGFVSDAAGDGFTIESNSVTQNPLFVNPGTDFHLQSNSPAIDAGTDVGLTQDFEGNPVPTGAAVDIGAYEYQGSTPPACVAADINCDTKVDVSDLILVSKDFGKTTGYNTKCDTNKDNIIDIFDVVYVASRFT